MTDDEYFKATLTPLTTCETSQEMPFKRTFEENSRRLRESYHIVKFIQTAFLTYWFGTLSTAPWYSCFFWKVLHNLYCYLGHKKKKVCLRHPHALLCELHFARIKNFFFFLFIYFLFIFIFFNLFCYLFFLFFLFFKSSFETGPELNKCGENLILKNLASRLIWFYSAYYHIHTEDCTE